MPTKPKKKPAAKLRLHQPGEPCLFTLEVFLIGGPISEKCAKKDPVISRTIQMLDEATLDSLGLEEGRSFGYWFDFGDDWWHQANVEAIDDKVPTGKFPKVTKRVGKSPPQYSEEDE